MSANPKEQEKPTWEQALERFKTDFTYGCSCSPRGVVCEYCEALESLRNEILALQDYIKDMEARDDRLVSIIDNFRAATYDDWAGSRSPLAKAFELVKKEGLA